MLKKFAITSLALFACVGVASAQCSSGSCSSGRGMSMMAPAMMVQSSSSWGSAAPAVERTPTIAFEQQSIDTFVNRARANAGLKPVTVTKELTDAARVAITPAALAGDDAKKLPMKEMHVVAVAHKTPFAAFQAWMANPEIRSAILSPNYRTCGVVAMKGSDGYVYRVLVMDK